MVEKWRATLFVWDGILSPIEEEREESEKDEVAEEKDAKNNGIHLKWEGTWVGKVGED